MPMRLLQALLCLALLAALPARAELTIEITEGSEGAQPIAVVPFGWTGPRLPADIAGVVAADLRRTGLFAPLAERDLLARPTEAGQIRVPDWRALRVDHVVVGRIEPAPAQTYMIHFQLYDVLRGAATSTYSIPSNAENLRRTAHQIADIIYEKLTGERGAFTTRVAYVTTTTGPDGKELFGLQVADADGHNPQTIVRSLQPILSPAWSPDGTRIAYVTFEQRRSEIYVQEVASGRRERVASAPGVNGAPAWSPDGTRLALVLSKGAALNVHVLDLRTRALRQVTDSPAIDTEPAWSVDGKSLVFTSDRGGQPQVYRVDAEGGTALRLTFEGNYNSRASYSPDGRHLVFVHGRGGNRFAIAVLELGSGNLRILTEGGLDESPSFAPNGSMILYATRYRNKGTLAAVSLNGRVHQRLTLEEGNVREPAWAPYERDANP